MKTPKKPALLKKLKSSSNKKSDATPLKAPPRVTSNTVSDYRDEVFAKAKKFKYPFHRSKHKIALISVAIVISAVILLGGGMLLSLYRWQNTGEFTKSVTRILPFPVAKVDGKFTLYESYLFELRSSVHWLEEHGTTDLRSPDGKRQIEHYKRGALDRAMVNTITTRLAKQNNVQVEQKEVDEVINRIKSVGGDGDLTQILNEELGSNESEIRRSIEKSILRKKVAFQLDKEAPKRAEKAADQLKNGVPFTEVAQKYSEDAATKQGGGSIGEVIRDKSSLPQQVTDALFNLKEGQMSKVISTTSDYFIVRSDKVLDKNRVKASVIRINVKTMNDYLEVLKNDNKISEYISITDDVPEELDLGTDSGVQK